MVKDRTSLTSLLDDFIASRQNRQTLQNRDVVTFDVKQAEALRAILYEHERQQQALDIHAIVSAADATGNITYANEKFCRVSGYSKEELLGKNHRIVRSGEHPPEFYADIWETISNGKIWNGEICNRAKDGHLYWVETSIVPFLDANGLPYQYISIRTDITHLKKVEAARQEALDRLRKIADRVPGFIYQYKLRPDGSSCFPYASEHIRELIRISPEEVREDASRAFAAIHPDDLEDVIESIQLSARDLTPWRHEFRVKFDDGAVRWLYGDSSPQREPDGSVLWHGFITDVTERKHADLELLASQSKLRGLYELSPLGIALTDMSGHYLEFNEAFRAICGYPAEELKNLDYWTLTPEEYKEQEFAQLESLGKTGRYGPYEKTYRQKNGDLIPIRLNGIVIKSQSGESLIWSIVEDITDSKKVEQSLIAARQEAESASRAKSKFLASMSHELRTPLNAILGFSQLFAMNTQLPQQARKNAQEIERAGKHLLSLVNDLIDLARIEADKLELSFEPVSVKTVVRDSLAMAASLAQNHNVSLIETDCNDAEITVRADYVRLRQVVINLLSNAIKYNRPPGKVSISCRINDGNARISVADTGPGIPGDKQSRIFNSFDRLDEEGGTVEGTGIGLVITKRIIEEMGGSIGFESIEGQGSTFWVDLPLIASTPAPALEQMAAGSVSARTSSVTGAQTNRLVVLNIEDNPTNMRLMQQIIATRKNLELRQACDAETGIELAQAHPPALILMDINLPGMDGYKALSILKADTRTAHIPVIAVSANAMMGDKERGMKAGFADYLTKPLDIVRFLEILDERLNLDGEIRV